MTIALLLIDKNRDILQFFSFFSRMTIEYRIIIFVLNVKLKAFFVLFWFLFTIGQLEHGEQWNEQSAT